MASSTSTVHSVAASLVAATNTTVSTLGVDQQVHSQPTDPIFLQTKLAQGIAGFFVWAALFLTCTQVRGLLHNYKRLLINCI